MKPIDLEKSIRRSVNCSPGLDFQELIKMPVEKMSEHDYITKQQTKKTSVQKYPPKYFRQFSMACASVIVVMVCFTAWFFEFKTPDSIIDLDVNPSIKIVTNRHNQVLSVKALNEEAQQIIEGQDFEQANLEKSVNAIVTSMISQGYIDDEKKMILITVENKNIEQANNLAVSVDQVVKETASTQNISTTVLRQTITTDKEAAALAEEMSLSTGKLKIIQEIASASDTLSVEVLAPLTVTELIKVSKENDVDLKKLIKSDDDYLAETVAPAVTTEQSTVSTTDEENAKTVKPQNTTGKDSIIPPVTVTEETNNNEPNVPVTDAEEKVPEQVPEKDDTKVPENKPETPDSGVPQETDKTTNSTDVAPATDKKATEFDSAVD